METEYTPAPKPRRPGLAPVSLGIAATALLLHALWGGNPVAAKFALTGFPPIGLMGLRFALAAMAVGAWGALRREAMLPARGELRPLLVNGALFTAQIATFALGVFWSTAAHAAVFVNSFPIFVVVFAHFWLVGDRLSAGKVLGVALGFAGVVAVFLDRWGGQPTMILGDVVLVASALVLGAKNTYLKNVLARVSPYKVVLSQMLISLAPFFAYSLAFEGLLQARPDAVEVAAVAYQGLVVGAFCFMVWTIILQRIPASKLAVFAFSTPLWGGVLSYLLLGEPLTWQLGLGMVLVAAGIAIAVRS